MSLSIPFPPRPRGVAALAPVLVLLLVLAPATSPAQESGSDVAGEADAGHAERRTAQNVRSRPNPVVPPPGYRRAVAAGTRTADGRPGEAYWQQWSEYDIDATLLPGERRLVGSGTIRYHNNSPDTLEALHLHLHQNIHRSGGARNEEQPVTGGMEYPMMTLIGDYTARGDSALYWVTAH